MEQLRTALEFHDSVLASLARVGGHVVLEFSPAYVHHWERRDGEWQGTGWWRHARIRILGGSLRGAAPGMPIKVNDGSLTIGDTEHSGLVPVPMSAQGVTTFRLELANGASCEVTGTGVVIETAVEGTHPEALPDEWAPKDNGPA